MARLLGFGARVFLPRGSAAARVEAIRSEGAEVAVEDDTYDEAVERAAREARERGPRALLIQDTSWAGYEEVPRQVIEGYSTILWEIEDQLAARSAAGPDVVLVQVGVGALAAAVVAHYRRAELATLPALPTLIGVEPARAACALAALEAGRVVRLPGPHDSAMAGLNCGEVASLAWPALRDGLDAAVAIDDARCHRAVRLLAAHGVESGESGAAGLAGLLELQDAPADMRAALGLGPRARALVLSTEGVTDPVAWRAIVGG
jgi:diaminopropionate ammonia-lyase